MKQKKQCFLLLLSSILEGTIKNIILCVYITTYVSVHHSRRSLRPRFTNRIQPISARQQKSDTLYMLVVRQQLSICALCERNHTDSSSLDVRNDEPLGIIERALCEFGLMSAQPQKRTPNCCIVDSQIVLIDWTNQF